MHMNIHIIQCVKYFIVCRRLQAGLNCRVYHGFVCRAPVPNHSRLYQIKCINSYRCLHQNIIVYNSFKQDVMNLYTWLNTSGNAICNKTCNKISFKTEINMKS